MRLLDYACSLAILSSSISLSVQAAPKHVLTEEEAVKVAESFIRENGYTKAPANAKKLADDPLDFGLTREQDLETRHDSLEPSAYGAYFVSSSEPPGWAIVFRFSQSYKKNNQNTNDQEFSINEIGRAVLMDKYGEKILINYKKNIPLSVIKNVRIQTRPENQSNENKTSSVETQKKVLFMAGEDCTGMNQNKKYPRAKTDPKIQAEFDRLLTEWNLFPASPFSSDSKTYTYDCPAFKKIIALGKPVIPCIMNEYLKPISNGWWTIALEDITGIGKNSGGWNFEKRKLFWSDWWDWKQGKRQIQPNLDAYDPKTW